MNIGIDFDGVIADTGAAKVSTAELMFGTVIALEDLKEHIVTEKNLMSRDNYRELMRAICEDETVHSQIPPVTQSIESIRSLLSSGHTLRVITSREAAAADLARAWLASHQLSDVPVVSVGYMQTKREAAADCDIFIDDDLHKLEPLIGHVPTLYLFSQPHNQHLILPKEIQRLNSWDSLSVLDS